MESFYSRFIDFFKIQPTSKLPLSHPERLKTGFGDHLKTLNRPALQLWKFFFRVSDPAGIFSTVYEKYQQVTLVLRYFIRNSGWI